MLISRKAFVGAQLYWRDVGGPGTAAGLDKVDLDVKLDDGTHLKLDQAPIGVTPLQNPDGSPHDHLYVVRYADGWTVENGWIDSTKNFRGIVTGTVNGAVTFPSQDVRLSLWCGLDIQRAGLPQYNPGVVDLSLLPAYGKTGPMKRIWSSLFDVSTNGKGFEVYTNMGTASGRETIGLIPGHDLPYALQGILWDDCRKAADHSICWTKRVRDPNTGMIVNPVAWPLASLVQVGIKTIRGPNPIVGKTDSPYTPSASHQTHFCIVSYLATHSDYDLEEILSWSAFQAGLGHTIPGRDYEKCLVSDSPRGMAWATAQIGYAAKLLPDSHPYKAVYRAIVKYNGDYWSSQYRPGGPLNNPFGIMGSGAVEYADSNGEIRGIPPWQNHHATSSFGMLCHFGFEEWTPMRDFTAALAVKSVCYQMLALYTFYVVNPSKYKAATRHDPSTWWTTWAELELDTLTHYANGLYADQVDVPCGSKVLGRFKLAGDTGSTTDFVSNLRPALATAVDAGLDGAAEAWDLFEKSISAHDWASCATYNIVPRGITT